MEDPQLEYESQRKTLWFWFSSSTFLWIPEIKIRLSVTHGQCLTYGAILMVSYANFLTTVL